MNRIVTGVALYSGGLDSILSIKLILDQGVHVEALIFQSPFFGAKINNNIPFLTEHKDLRFSKIDITPSFMKVVASPRYGYGKHLNPCIDCRILMLHEAKLFMESIGADFVFTGEVLGQRPMSQRRDILRVSERESGLDGVLLRPLSAKLLHPTRVEDAGLIDRERLLDLNGRSRKRQIEMANDLNWKEFPTPAGGCLLTDKTFANKLKLLLEKGMADPDIIKWLKIGRHFILPCGTMIVVGRNHVENTLILDMAGNEEILIKTITVPGPVALVLGQPSEETKRFAASLMAGYSDFKGADQVEVALGRGGDFKKQIKVSPLLREETKVYRI